jgi:hypothetical protein
MPPSSIGDLSWPRPVVFCSQRLLFFLDFKYFWPLTYLMKVLPEARTKFDIYYFITITELMPLLKDVSYLSSNL